MQAVLKEKIIEVCDRKIKEKGQNIGLSFYAFFVNKNDNPQLLMEAAELFKSFHFFLILIELHPFSDILQST
jgi:Family of unknown function (DUF6500)